ncbi:CRISPR-associated RAMP protein Csx10 [Leptolyngbya sp. PCC 6406]|uniref:type III-D CRISPR-associated RAMP protein Csx10 n=1 Tax=Leptolyngbya sp. PCC 6406 TaxID=1173264 RepID=UPI0002AC9238|nr:CRISPR-associated RAMP protein Csx10 [Leptolyngbya sp. PCC 6406]
MTTLQLTITARAPLAIGRQKPGGSISEAQTYIPGSVIRGAIAGKMLRQVAANETPGETTDLAQPGGDFERLFTTEDAAVFSNAYPSLQGQPALVLPATAVSSKTSPGFRSEKGGNEGVFDTLIDGFCAEGHGYPYEPSCLNGDRAEPYSQFYTIENGRYQTQSVDTRLLTRVGINRRRATAQEQVLYSIEVINETQGKAGQPTIFSSSIALEDATLASQLATYLEQQQWRLGGSASRGLGKVDIQVSEPSSIAPVATRIEAFNHELRKRWQQWGEAYGGTQDLPSDRQFFTLDLQSDAILTEQWRRTTVVSPAMLCQMAGIGDDQLQLHSVYSSYDYCSGWNAAWGLMKDVELVTQRGAVYLWSTSQLDQWISPLAELEIKGVGERTPEGFGQVKVCDQFHQVFREAAV